MKAPDFVLAAAVSGLIFVLVLGLGAYYRAGTLTFTSGLVFVGATVIGTVGAIAVASSTGVPRLFLGPTFLIGVGIGLLYWNRTRSPGSIWFDRRRTGWFLIAAGMVTAVVSVLTHR